MTTDNATFDRDMQILQEYLDNPPNFPGDDPAFVAEHTAAFDRPEPTSALEFSVGQTVWVYDSCYAGRVVAVGGSWVCVETAVWSDAVGAPQTADGKLVTHARVYEGRDGDPEEGFGELRIGDGAAKYWPVVPS